MKKVILIRFIIVIISFVYSLPFDSGLVAIWHFNENGGSVLVDSSGNGNNGSIIGATWETGISGSALHFDGVSNHVNLGNVFDSLTNITVSAWIRCESINESSGSFIDVFCNNIVFGLNLYVASSSTLLAHFNIGNKSGWASPDIYSSIPIQLNTWYQLVGSWNRNDSILKLYVNGVLQDSIQTNKEMGPSSYPTLIGAQMVSSLRHPFNGKIDEVSIYNRVLSDIQIKNMWLATLQRPALISAVASDGINKVAGVDNDDEVLFLFDGPIQSNLFNIVASNIDFYLPLNNGHSWLSGFGTIGNALWHSDQTKLLIELSSASGIPNICVGDSVSLTSFGNKVRITGSFEPISVELGNKIDSEELFITPNPITAYALFKVPNRSSRFDIKIYSADGKLVLSRYAIKQSHFIWLTEELTNGIYIVNVRYDNNCFQRCVCILK